MIRVLVVDDQTLVRAGVTLLLRTAGEDVVGEATDGLEAVRMAERLRPDVILMDLRMPRVDGIEATRRILKTLPATRIVMLTTFDDDAEVYGALRAGAVGYLLKDGEPDAMLSAVRRAAQGESLLAPAVMARVVRRAVQSHHQDVTGDAADPAILATLTPRERDVLALVGVGQSNAEIAESLHLAHRRLRQGGRGAYGAGDGLVGGEAALVGEGEQGVRATTTARSRLSWANASGSVAPRVPPAGASAWSMRPKRMPGRVFAVSGRVMVAAIIARTEPWRARMPRSRNSQANAIRSTGSRESATGPSASAGSGQTPARASPISDGRSGKYR
jgi:DNA-binding NarL/FixJ family response regulator